MKKSGFCDFLGFSSFCGDEKIEILRSSWIFVLCLGMKKSRFCEIFAGLWWMKKSRVVPAEKQVEDHPGYLFEEGICGVRNDENEGGDQKPVASFSNMYVEVVADISRKQVPGICGNSRMFYV